MNIKLVSVNYTGMLATYPYNVPKQVSAGQEEKEYEIWRQGYVVTEGSDGARLLGKAKGVDFTNAVLNFQRAKPTELSEREAKEMAWWGCRLFDNEADARKFFG